MPSVISTLMLCITSAIVGYALGRISIPNGHDDHEDHAESSMMVPSQVPSGAVLHQDAQAVRLNYIPRINNNVDTQTDPLVGNNVDTQTYPLVGNNVGTQTYPSTMELLSSSLVLSRDRTLITTSPIVPSTYKFAYILKDGVERGMLSYLGMTFCSVTNVRRPEDSVMFLSKSMGNSRLEHLARHLDQLTVNVRSADNLIGRKALLLIIAPKEPSMATLRLVEGGTIQVKTCAPIRIALGYGDILDILQNPDTCDLIGALFDSDDAVGLSYIYEAVDLMTPGRSTRMKHTRLRPGQHRKRAPKLINTVCIPSVHKDVVRIDTACITLMLRQKKTV